VIRTSILVGPSAAGVALVLGGLCVPAVAGDAGALRLDGRFGSNGSVGINGLRFSGTAVDAAIDCRNRPVVLVSEEGGAAVLRFLPNGRLDTTFGVNGRAQVTNANAGQAIALEALIGCRTAVAWFPAGATSDTGRVTLLTPQGVLDGTFGGAGTATVPIGITDLAEAESRIVAAGFTSGASGSAAAIAALTPTGTLDSTFGKSGTFELPTPDSAFARHVEVDGLGRVMVSGQAGPGSTRRTIVARLTAGGQQDASFGNGGLQSLAGRGTDNPLGTGLAASRAGAWLVSGSAVVSGRSRGTLAKLTVEGRRDPTFGRQGVASSTAVAQFTGVAAFSDGSAVGVAPTKLVHVAKDGGVGSTTIPRAGVRRVVNGVGVAAGHCLYFAGTVFVASGSVQVPRIALQRYIVPRR